MRKFIISIAVLVVLGTAAYFLFFSRDPVFDIAYRVSSGSTQTYTGMVAAKQAQANKDAEYYNTAIATKSRSQCELISDQAKKEECLDMVSAGEAREKKDITLCDAIKNPSLQMLCKDSILADSAIAKKDLSLCSQISDATRQSACREALEGDLLRSRIQSRTVTADFCATLSPQYQALCTAEIRQIDENTLFQQAVAQMDANLCTQITNATLKDTCHDTVVFQQAIKTQDATLCRTLVDTAKREYCQTQLSRVQDATLYKAAIAALDLPSCDKITTSTLRDKCHDTVVLSQVKSSRNKALCQTLRDTKIINACQSIAP